MTFDLPTLANWASLVCLPTSLAGAVGFFVGLFPDGRNFMARHPRWIVTIIVLIVALASFDLAAHVGLFRASKLAVINNQIFQNQVVTVDGNDFVDCTFTNVTFKYNGGNYALHTVHISGPLGIFSEDHTIQTALDLAFGLHLFKDDVTRRIFPQQ